MTIRNPCQLVTEHVQFYKLLGGHRPLSYKLLFKLIKTLKEVFYYRH